jgi:hypothetical protein
MPDLPEYDPAGSPDAYERRISDHSWATIERSSRVSEDDLER